MMNQEKERVIQNRSNLFENLSQANEMSDQSNWIEHKTCWEWSASQGTPSWLRARQGRITASKMSAACGMSPFDRDPFVLANQIACVPGHEQFFTPVQAQRMAFGLSHEPMARQWISDQLKRPIAQHGLMAWKEDDRIAASLDGIIVEFNTSERRRGIEIKCPVAMYKSLLGKSPEQISVRDIYRTHYDQMMTCGVIAGLEQMVYVVCGQDGINAYTVLDVDLAYFNRELYPKAIDFYQGEVESVMRQNGISRLPIPDKTTISKRDEQDKWGTLIQQPLSSSLDGYKDRVVHRRYE